MVERDCFSRITTGSRIYVMTLYVHQIHERHANADII